MCVKALNSWSKIKLSIFLKIFADLVPKQNWMLVKRSVTNLKTANTGDNLQTIVQTKYQTAYLNIQLAKILNHHNE